MVVLDCVMGGNDDRGGVCVVVVSPIYGSGGDVVNDIDDYNGTDDAISCCTLI